MPKVSVSERALRELLKKVLEAHDLNVPEKANVETNPVNVNSVVDPSAAETQPDDADFLPQNKKEMQIAIRQQLDRVADDDASSIYAAVKSAIDKEIDTDAAERAKKDAEAKSNRRVESMSHSLREKVAENVLRRKIRKILIEAGYESLAYSGINGGDDDDEVRRPRKKLSSMHDVDGAVLDNIAKEYGRSMAGAKRIVHVAESHIAFLGDLIQKRDDSFTRLIDHSFHVFIDMLYEEMFLSQREGPGENVDFEDDPDPGAFTKLDIDTMIGHPKDMMQMNSFRVVSGYYLNNLMKKAAEDYVTDPDFAEDLEREVTEWCRMEKPNLSGEEFDAFVAKSIDKCKKNPSYDVVNFQSFHDFVIEMWDFTDEDFGPEPADLRTLITRYLDAETGRTGKGEEGE